MVLNQYTEVTVVHVNGKLYVKTTTADGCEEFDECQAISLATSEDELDDGPVELAPACEPYTPYYTEHWRDYL